MSDVLDTIQVFFICVTVLSIAFVMLLAMPKSKLRSYLVEVMKYIGAAIFIFLVLSPIDIIPDVLPILGWGDDLGYLAGAIASIKSARKEQLERKHLK